MQIRLIGPNGEHSGYINNPSDLDRINEDVGPGFTLDANDVNWPYFGEG